MTQERALLRSIVQCYTPTGEEQPVAAHLVDHFHRAGLEASIDGAGNFVGCAGPGPVEVVLLGHIDTVPGEIRVREENGKLYGRGAVDAKGPMATFASATLRLAATGALANTRLIVIGAVAEEGGSQGARHIVDRYRPRHLIIGEPGGWDSIVLGYKGSLRIEYRLERSTRHSAGPDESVPEVAVAFWHRLSAWCDDVNAGKRVFDQISPALRMINTHGNGFSDTVAMDIHVRLPLEYGPEILREKLEAWAGEADIAVVFGDPAVKGGKNTPLVRAFLGALRDQGAQPRFKVKTGTSDMNVVAPAWCCPMLAYGPGDSALDHTPEEHIELDEYDRAIGVLETALRNLDKAVAG